MACRARVSECAFFPFLSKARSSSHNSNSLRGRGGFAERVLVTDVSQETSRAPRYGVRRVTKISRRGIRREFVRSARPASIPLRQLVVVAKLTPRCVDAPRSAGAASGWKECCGPFLTSAPLRSARSWVCVCVPTLGSFGVVPENLNFCSPFFAHAYRKV